MAGFEELTNNITVSRAGTFILPFYLESEDGNRVNIGADVLTLTVEGYFSVNAVLDPSDATMLYFKITKAMAGQLPARAMPYNIVRWSSGEPYTIIEASIAAEGFA